jgi:hypothetical protein
MARLVQMLAREDFTPFYQGPAQCPQSQLQLL